MTSAPPEDGSTPAPNAEATAAQDAESAAAGEVESTITDEQWKHFQDLLAAVYAHRLNDGHDPSKLFHRKVNRRAIPAYYEVIQEPIALSTIKARINLKQYRDVPHFVRDFALIPHNAQVYNRPDAGAYLDALEVKKVLQQELKKLVDSKVITAEEAALPFLGEIPQVEDAPAGEGAEEEEEEDEEDEDEEEGEESDDSRGGKRKKRRTKRSKADKEDAAGGTEGEARKRRMRPPKVDTPNESRIKNVLKAIRRPKAAAGHPKILQFERLPDKAVMPEYYAEIKNPMSIDTIKIRFKRKKYQSMEAFMADMELVFENAKSYNLDDSEIYKDATSLQIEARRLAAEELEKPDTDFVSEDGKVPLPHGVTHSGELYKTGDWIHLQNANDLTKPIPAQIYRTWQDAAGGKFINACWYYRPEQTVHRFDRHFFDGEIVKTGQYRDHHVEEIVDRCFVMFVTRYNRGRPRGFPKDKDVYVCEDRYNEEKHTFNRINTWASCLPDEVRDKDYEMDLFKESKRMKKIPSPIAYLLKDEQKETDDLPSPQWGADNAPPKIGAVHRRPRHPKDSPPPEPTPPPPPVVEPPPAPAVQAPPQSSNADSPLPPSYSQNQSSSFPPDSAQRAMAAPHSTPNSMPTSQQRPYMNNNNTTSAAPLSRQTSTLRAGYSAHSPSTTRPHTSSMSTTNPTTYNPSNTAPTTNTNRYSSNNTVHNPSTSSTTAANTSTTNLAASYQAPQPMEVWYLAEQANSAIPREIRQQFQCDADGHVLFFTSPPLDVKSEARKGEVLGHSARYLAKMKERERLKKEAKAASAAAANSWAKMDIETGKKRNREDGEQPEQEEEAKRVKLQDEAYARKVEAVSKQARAAWERQMREATERDMRTLYGDGWEAHLPDALATATAQL